MATTTPMAVAIAATSHAPVDGVDEGVVGDALELRCDLGDGPDRVLGRVGEGAGDPVVGEHVADLGAVGRRPARCR